MIFSVQNSTVEDGTSFLNLFELEIPGLESVVSPDHLPWTLVQLKKKKKKKSPQRLTFLKVSFKKTTRKKKYD